ncbi:MAG: transposase [Candidatus Nanopelagicales bacterium]
MEKCILIGCDLHDRNMRLKIAVGREPSAKRSWSNDPAGRVAMIADLKQRAATAGATRLVFAYEASGLGFCLYDELQTAGIECHVLAPTLIERSVKQVHRKTDERDADRILAYQVGSFLGLTPKSQETGETEDRKGHITREGPARLRMALCQAVWSRVRTDEQARAKYERIAEKNPTHKKKGIVALMRDLGITMWHKAKVA